MKQGKELLSALLASVILTGIVAGIFLLLALLSGAVLETLGIEYDSLGSFFLFFLVYFLYSLPIELLTAGVSGAFWRLGYLKREKGAFFYLLDLLGGWSAVSLGDLTVASVSLPFWAGLIFAGIMTFSDPLIERLCKGGRS
jgi:hypothetical protein